MQYFQRNDTVCHRPMCSCYSLRVATCTVHSQVKKVLSALAAVPPTGHEDTCETVMTALKDLLDDVDSAR